MQAKHSDRVRESNQVTCIYFLGSGLAVVALVFVFFGFSGKFGVGITILS
jgi:hypothetical protein